MFLKLMQKYADLHDYDHLLVFDSVLSGLQLWSSLAFGCVLLITIPGDAGVLVFFSNISFSNFILVGYKCCVVLIYKQDLIHELLDGW